METVTIPLQTYMSLIDSVKKLEKEILEKRPVSYQIWSGLTHSSYNFQFTDESEIVKNLCEELNRLNIKLVDEKKKKRPFIKF